MAKAAGVDRESPCACTLLRKASRAVARRYEAELGRAGLSATQFALLRALDRHGPTDLSRLAEAMVLERTSLYRAIRPLVRQGLVAVSGIPERHAKEATLTTAGRARIRQALPHWRQAHAAFVDGLGGARWANLARELDDLLFLVGPPG